MTNLHDIAPRLAKARDQRVAELEERRRRQERIVVSMRRFQDAAEALGRAAVKALEPMQRFAEAWTDVNRTTQERRAPT